DGGAQSWMVAALPFALQAPGQADSPHPDRALGVHRAGGELDQVDRRRVSGEGLRGRDPAAADPRLAAVGDAQTRAALADPRPAQARGRHGSVHHARGDHRGADRLRNRHGLCEGDGVRLPPEHPEALLAQWLVLSGVVSASQMEEAEDHMLRSGQSLAKALSTLGHSAPETLEISVGQALGLGRSQPRLGEVLLKRGQLSPEGLQQALLTQARTGRRLGEVLVELGLCSWAQVYGALESQTDPARQTPIRTPAVAKPAKATRPRVVIIDDSPIALAMLEHGLVQNGYEVLPFGEPHQALLFLRDAPVDVVLTDMEMPGMSGLELCRRLKEPPYPALPVIILTANEEDALRVDGLRAGAEDYVSKTSSMDELLARIDSVLRRVGEARRVRSIFARYTSE